MKSEFDIQRLCGRFYGLDMSITTGLPLDELLRSRGMWEAEYWTTAQVTMQHVLILL